MTMERNAGKHDEFCGRVEAIDVCGRICFGIAQSLCIGEDDVHCFAGRRHPAQDVVTGPVQNARNAGEFVTSKPLSHAVNERHAAAHGGLEAEPHTGTSRFPQQLGPVGREQHLVGRDHRSASLDRLADPFARGCYTADNLNNDVRSTGEDFIEVVGPDDRGRYPIGALASDTTIEHVGQVESVGQLRALDQDSGNGGADSSKTEKRDLEWSLRLRALRSWLPVPRFSFWTLGLRHRSTVYRLQLPYTEC
jgi:hypothetical protein